MANENKPKASNEVEENETDEISEEQLESVSGGILIGLNQPGIKFAHKDLTAHKELLDPSLTSLSDSAFKFQK